MGLPEIPNAPKGITPHKFFGEWLPAQFKTMMPLVQQFAGDLKAAMAIKVEGGGGGEWTCTLSKDGLKIDQGLSADAVATMVLDEKSFISAVTGERKMAMQPPGGAPSPDQIPGLLQRNLEIIKSIQGVFRFKIDDPQKGDFAVTIKLAGPMKPEPDVTVSMDGDSAEAMAKGELDPQSAFMSGKMMISGDISLLMQLMPLMMQ